MTLTPKYISYSIGCVLVSAIVLIGFATRKSDIDRIERVINQRIAAIAESEEERIRAIVQHEVAILVSGNDRIPPNMIQSVAVGQQLSRDLPPTELARHAINLMADAKLEARERINARYQREHTGRTQSEGAREGSGDNRSEESSAGTASVTNDPVKPPKL